MTRVLGAERDAEAAVADCENQARTLIERARERANRIAAQTDERITRIKLRRAQWVAGEISKQARIEHEAQSRQAPELDETGLAECIEAVSALLTGERPK